MMVKMKMLGGPCVGSGELGVPEEPVCPYCGEAKGIGH